MTDPRVASGQSMFLPLGGWVILHAATTWMACLLAIAIRFHAPDGSGNSAIAIYGLSTAAAMLLGHALKVGILDFLGQLQYREKFLLFLVHVGAMLVPWFFGYREWSHGLAALATVLCFQFVARVTFGRICATTILLVVPALLYPPQPPFWLVAAWAFVLLVAFRAEHVRLRLETYGHGEGIELGDAIRGTMAGAVLPWAVGCAVWFVADAAFGNSMRTPRFEPGPMNAARGGNIGPVAPTDLIWDVVMIMAVIIALLLAIYWLEKFLRTNRKGSMAAAEAAGEGRETRLAREANDEASAEEPFGDDPRGRVLARFRAFDRALARVGLQRRDEETAAEFIARLARSLAGTAEPMAPVFDQACYAPAPPTEEEAATFLRVADDVEPRAIDLAEKSRFLDGQKEPSWRDDAE